MAVIFRPENAGFQYTDYRDVPAPSSGGCSPWDSSVTNLGHSCGLIGYPHTLPNQCSGFNSCPMPQAAATVIRCFSACYNLRLLFTYGRVNLGMPFPEFLSS